MFLGIDIGTSSIKTALINAEFKLIAEKQEELIVSHPHPLWSEQNPHDWWHATCKTMHKLKQEFPKEMQEVQAIGLSGQQHGATLIDQEGKVLRPCILWNDTRSFQECEDIQKQLPECWEITGNQVMPGFTAPKILWVSRHEKELFKKIHKVLLPKDYLRFLMTGEFVSDVSDTSGMLLMNVKERKYSDAMIQAVHLSKEQLPTLVEGTQITGSIHDKIAADWGIPTKTPVVGGGGDNPCGAMSVGVYTQGKAFISLGTSGVYFVAADRYQANPADAIHTFCHCIPDHWHHMSVNLSCGNCLNWFADVSNTPLQTLLADAEKEYAPNIPLYFLPYLSGERTPHNSPFARGVFFGLNTHTTTSHMMNAILEGVAMNFKQGQEAMLRAGIKIREVSVVGGGSKSLFWGKILANVLDRPLVFHKDRDVGAAVGAARLAAIGKKSLPLSQYPAESKIEAILEPDSETKHLYQEKYGLYQSLYPKLESAFEEAYRIRSHSK